MNYYIKLHQLARLDINLIINIIAFNSTTRLYINKNYSIIKLLIFR
jgi:hypothetical protein